jgi:DnaJ-class molecular chaperone
LSVASHDCFADEIAIDFPSVNPLVERVRDAFLGEREDDDTVTAEVSLTAGEAFRGTVIPIEVRLRGTCRECGGRGETWTEPCLACCGTGDAMFRHLVSVSVPARVADGARFRFRISSPHAAPARVEVRVVIRQNFRI